MSGMFPFGGDAFGGSGFDPFATLLIDDTVGVSSIPDAFSIISLYDTILASEILSPQRNRFVTNSDEIKYAEALAVAWQVALAENVALTGTAAADLNKIAAIVDTLHASGDVTTRIDALAIVSTVLAINSLLATGWQISAIDSVAFQDALQAQLAIVTALVDSAGFVGTPAPAMRMTALLSDKILLVDGLSTSLEAIESLKDGVQFYATFRLGDAEYAGWVMNEGAASEYRNYPFNGFINFNRGYYGSSETGFYELDGDTDQGKPIDAWIKTALMDFGTGKFKKVPDVYVGFIGGNQLVLRVITTNAGVQTEHRYTTTVPAGDVMHNGRIEVGRGLESRYWQFQLSNVSGAKFELDDIEWRPIMLDRRI